MSGVADAVLNVVTLGGYGQMKDAKAAAKASEKETKRLLQQGQEARPPIETFRRRQMAPTGGAQSALPSGLLTGSGGSAPLMGQ